MTKLGLSLFGFAVFLSLFGIFLFYESSSYTAVLSLGDKYYFVKNQIVWFFIGITLCIFLSKINYKKYYNLALPMLLGTLFLLVLVFVPGIGLELKGAHRWLNLGFTVMQPSEILKITLTVYFAAWLSTKEKGRLVAFLMLLGLSLFLVLIEPDMGTAMIIGATGTILYFLSGASWRDMGVIGAIMLIAVVILIAVAPYRLQRLVAYQNFDHSDLSTTSYHVKQILVAVGSGGLTGLGFGNSVQKYAYLPESTTDSIFAIYAEETGFVGSVLLILFFGVFTTLGFLIALNAPDQFGKLLCAGIVSFIAIQAFVNIASQAVLIPLTGVPLPFLSYGGSSLVINFASIGIILSIARPKTHETVKPHFKRQLIKKL